MSIEIERLCNLLRCSPCHILDFSLMVFGAGLCVDPALIERLMTHRGEFDESKSIKENVRERYGSEAENLVDICIDQWAEGKSYGGGK